MSDASDGFEGLHVLVVSDDPLVREEARFGFPSGVTVSFAVDARGAEGSLSTHLPTVVVVDMQTGSAGGYALAKYMRETPSLSEVPILMLLERPQDDWVARQGGATANAVKPLGSGRLVTRVLHLASARGGSTS
jgi:DNA-binding response OmpR family regulator